MAGDNISHEVFEEGIGQSDVFILVWSTNACDSRWVWEELDAACAKRASDKGYRIIPVLIEDIDLPVRLKNTKYRKIEDTGSYDSDFRNILKSIQSHSHSWPEQSSIEFKSDARGPHALSISFPDSPQYFCNRQNELARLNKFLKDSTQARGPRIVVLHGMPGVGKSILASHWVHLALKQFPGGGLHADFLSHDPSKLPDLDEILGNLLRDLLIGSKLRMQYPEIPKDRKLWRDHYQRLTASKRILMFAENVTQYAQIKYTMPRGPGSLIIVTTNEYPKEFDLENAECIELQTFDRRDSMEMIRSLLENVRKCDSEEDLNALAEGCGDLPIALSVSASQLRHHKSWPVSYFMTRIHDKGIFDALDEFGSEQLIEVFNCVYKSLEPDTQRLYRRLSLFPGVTVTSYIAEALTDISGGNDCLKQLHDANLVTEITPGRYNIHNLIAEHMKQVFADDETEGTDHHLVRSLVDWYCRALKSADIAVVEDRLRLATDLPSVSKVAVPELASPKQAHDWYATERCNIIPVMKLAYGYDLHEHVWQMAEAMWLLYSALNYYNDWKDSVDFGIDAAEECKHIGAQARLRILRARYLADDDQHEKAASDMSEAKFLAAGTDNLTLQASVEEFEGVCAMRAGKKERAHEAFTSARNKMQQVPNTRGVAIIDYLLSKYHLQFESCSAYEDALAASLRALSVFEEIQDMMNVAKVRMQAAKARLGLGEPSSAVEDIELAIELSEQLGIVYHRAEAHELAADAYSRIGQHQKAEKHRREARGLYSELGYPNSPQRMEAEPVDAEVDDDEAESGGQGSG